MPSEADEIIEASLKSRPGGDLVFSYADAVHFVRAALEAANKGAPKYSAQWICEEVSARNSTWLNHHECCLCGHMVGYGFQNGLVTFESGCGCSWSPGRHSSYQEIADWLAMQSSDEIRDKIMDGLK